MSDGVEEYRGKEIVVRFDGRKCIHSRNCVLGRPDVFVPNAPGPWIKPDNAAAETIAGIALSCPSGAIAYERLDGGPQETAPPVNVVRIRENGPLAFHAELAIEGEQPAFRRLARDFERLDAGAQVDLRRRRRIPPRQRLQMFQHVYHLLN